MGYERIKSSEATRMLCGSTSDGGPYIWAGFDAMKVCTYKYNHEPVRGSRPMSATASGFVPACGAGALVLESLEAALERGAPIYAELLGGHINSGGQRGGGSMTAPNSAAVQRCIQKALESAGVRASDIDLISGHLTATAKDPVEIENWSAAMGLRGTEFPLINSLKSHTGHCLSASGSIESIAAILQMQGGFVFPNRNCEDLHPDIEALVSADRIPRELRYQELNVVAKASFGFGDVNACIVFKKYADNC
jgi:3-oxoacyl-(acyl-carrier-protein) synthase